MTGAVKKKREGGRERLSWNEIHGLEEKVCLVPSPGAIPYLPRYIVAGKPRIGQFHRM